MMGSGILAEFVGTLLLILFGNGVVANVVLARTKGNNSGWIVITIGWGLAVFIGAFCSAKYSGAHLNPAVTLAMAMAGKLAVGKVAGYIIAQMLGAIAGAVLVYLFYHEHFKATDDADAKLADRIRQRLPDDPLTQELVGEPVVGEEVVVEEMSEGAVTHVVEQAGHPQELLQKRRRRRVGTDPRQRGGELLREPPGHVHDPEGVGEATVLGGGKHPPRGLQLRDAAQPLHPRGVDEILLGGLSRALALRPRVDEVPVDGVGDESLPAVGLGTRHRARALSGRGGAATRGTG